MLYADVDNLKEINDIFGHKEGDMALIDVANILRKNYREADIIARIGGDEFVVIPVETTGDNIDIISSRLQKSLKIHNAEKNHKYKLSISVGIAYYSPENPCSVDELLVRADKSMYEQKMHKKKP
jgi:diguanylate cyclase (GGDEF)-like protein